MVIRRCFLWKLLILFLLWTSLLSFLLQIHRLWHRENSRNLHEDISDSFVYRTLSAISPAVPFHPFKEGEQKMLVILTYQRSGSTFFGGMFNLNPKVFYLFEPLDSFYSSFYGTPMRWNVPSDITSYRNGSHRSLPDVEVNAVSEFLATLLSCNVTSLPAETLIHPYMYYYQREQYLAAAEYIECITRYEEPAQKCSSYVPRYSCGGRFGEVSDEQLRDCHEVLHNEEVRKHHKERADFDKYVSCMQGLKRIVTRKCSSIWQGECRKRKLIVAKTVRATMDSMEPLLSKFPNFRIVHLVRDPRGVVRSRRECDSSVRGLYTESKKNDTLVREARIFCRALARDLRMRKELEKKYPGRIYPILYDDLVKDIWMYAKNIYRFLGLSDPTGDVWWNETIGSYKSTENVQKANQWMNSLTFKENIKILRECSSVFQTLAYPPWL